MKAVKRLRHTSTADLIKTQEFIIQELDRRKRHTTSIDARLKICDLPLRAVTRSTLLLDIKKHIEPTGPLENNLTIKHLLFQLPLEYWTEFGKSYPKYYIEVKEALLKQKVDLNILLEGVM